MAEYYGWEPFETWRILDCIDSSEYVALSEAKKDFLKIIISAGAINFREASPMWNLLHTIFPDGTSTWTAVLAASKRVYNPTPS